MRSLRTEDPGKWNAQKLPSNDITAIFPQNAALSGQVNINTVNADPTSGLVELPDDIVDQSGLIAQGCAAKRGDVLIITGRGGLPSLPNQALRSHQTATIDWVTQGGGEELVSDSKAQNQILPAIGWVINDKGDVTLIDSRFRQDIKKYLSTNISCQ